MSLYIILPIKLIQKWGSILVIGVGMTISGFVAVPFTGIIGASLSMSFDIFLAFAGIILIGTIFAYTAFLKGASMVGPVKSSLFGLYWTNLCGILCFHDYGRYLLSCRFSWYGNDFIGCDYYFFKDLMLEKRKKSA